MKLAALLSFAIIATCSQSGTSAAPAAPSTMRYWIIQGAAAQAMTENPVAVSYFANPNRTVILSARVQAPSSWHVIPFQTYTSFKSFQKALENGKVRPNVKAVLYDNEHQWRFTPDDEKADPAGFTKQFEELAHAHGYLLIGTHAGGGSNAALAGDISRYSDFFSIQSQRTEIHLDKYTSTVNETAAACRAANPNIKVLAGLTTNIGGTDATADQIVAAAKATARTVDGYWLNIPQRSEYDKQGGEFRPEIAVGALEQLAKSGQ